LTIAPSRPKVGATRKLGQTRFESEMRAGGPAGRQHHFFVEVGHQSWYSRPTVHWGTGDLWRCCFTHFGNGRYD
jgi:hypothetical protein